MRRVWMAAVLGVLAVGLFGVGRPASSEPTKYCGARIEEAEDTVKEIETALSRITDAQDKNEIQAWVTQAKSHIVSAKGAAQEEDCVLQVELAKTLTQDALYLAAQTK
ncbi:MAG: hypothetical protein HY002_12330 [Candidatus Rokubacteria bacterium]|nr:hypothetical protein [Candidatus Rokubacteria bacterium]